MTTCFDFRNAQIRQQNIQRFFAFIIQPPLSIGITGGTN